MWFAAGLLRFDLALEFGVFAAAEYQSGQAQSFVRGQHARQSDNDLPGGLEADNGGGTRPADDLRDEHLCEVIAAPSALLLTHPR